MIITKTGKYILTENYDRWVSPWETVTVHAGTTIEIDGIGIQYKEGQVHSGTLGWVPNDLPLFPMPQPIVPNNKMTWGNA